MFVLTELIPDDLRLISTSTISDTKGDATTTILLVTVLLPRTETVMDVQKIPSVLLYPSKLGDILCMRKQSVSPRVHHLAWLRAK